MLSASVCCWSSCGRGSATWTCGCYSSCGPCPWSAIVPSCCDPCPCPWTTSTAPCSSLAPSPSRVPVPSRGRAPSLFPCPCAPPSLFPCPGAPPCHPPQLSPPPFPPCAHHSQLYDPPLLLQLVRPRLHALLQGQALLHPLAVFLLFHPRLPPLLYLLPALPVPSLLHADPLPCPPQLPQRLPHPVACPAAPSPLLAVFPHSADQMPAVPDAAPAWAHQACLPELGHQPLACPALAVLPLALQP
mmetsp:Transcript_2413/g.6225  ORF Transcript_2413/g.6225 Transcript_2413/m.6225 type:complete len:244 (-) Transcript_2413:71-802(-)